MDAIVIFISHFTLEFMKNSLVGNKLSSFIIDHCAHYTVI
ncbi:DUF3307 domain-containing protein [bacterium]|nr:DUF3307 domain-containing protein [bacterium]